MAIDFHPSVLDAELRQKAIESLKANRIDPKFLYVTPRQAELWRQVSLRHSPIHGNPEFTRIYRDAFAGALDRIDPGKILLVGLGCGTGAKELELYSSLQRRGHEVLFTAVDVSHDLVLESSAKLITGGAEHQRSLVCDLTQAVFLGEWLDRFDHELPRLVTFFGLVPNFAPAAVASIFRVVLGPGDLLLVSAHLAPVRDENPAELTDAMKSVLPQYDNPETLAWLAAALEEWQLENLVAPPEIQIGQVDGVPAFLGLAKWKTTEPFEKWGHHLTPKTEEPLQLFQSLRYTPALFEDMLRREGFGVERLALTGCREEAIWAIRCR